MAKGWIGVDLDGTLAHYDGWKGVDHVGEPIKPMVDEVRQWLLQGKDVRIFTARVAEGEKAVVPIQQWCLKVFNRVLPITNVKDFQMIVLFDDRAVTVEQNTGKILVEGWYAAS